jgi:carbohydrate-binding DOMON domain-containing protein
VCFALSLALTYIGAVPAQAETLSFKDPKGDDDGFGKAKYPTGKEYTPGAFDMTGLVIREDGDFIVFEVELAGAVTDPWKSAEWNGNGFSLQLVQIYLDLDGKPRSGERKGVPGSWVEFKPDSYWEKVVMIAPQPASQVLGQIDAKAKWLKSKVVVPDRTEARGNKLIARVASAAIGQKPSAKWGVQALMMSANGLDAAPEDVLARRMNEIEGEHRFGGGCDAVGDPQVIDIFAGKGKASEVEDQHKQLSGWSCSDDPKKAKLAQLSMVRR